MKVMIRSRFGGTVFAQGWVVATGQAEAAVFELGEDGPYCHIFFYK